METQLATDAARPATTAVERHFTAQQLGELWGVSEDTIRRMFLNEPGVVFLGTSLTTRGRRRYRVLRIPQSVVERVHRRNTVASKTGTR